MKKNILNIINYNNFSQILMAEASHISKKIYDTTKKRELNRLYKDLDYLKSDLENIDKEINESVLKIFEKYRKKHVKDFDNYCENLYEIYKNFNL